jgi:hypothetical protein
MISLSPGDLVLQIGLLAVLVLFPVAGMVDALMQPEDAWRATGHSRVAWVVLQALVPVIGCGGYFLAVRRDLVEHQRVDV